MSNNYGLETKELTRKFGSQTAVDHVSLHIPKGAVYGLVGRNGAGKTTIMKMITNLIHTTSGDIYINGKKESPRHHQAVGTLIEEPGYMPNLSAYENLLSKCRLMNVKQPDKQAQQLLEAMKLEKTGKKAVKNFSLGMRQRVGIALAFCGFPSLVLLDEPINALDPQGIIEVREFLSKMKKEGMTILISSHLLDELLKVADYFGIISKGKLVKELSRQEMDQLTKTNLCIRVDKPTEARELLLDLGDIPISDHVLKISKEKAEPAILNERLLTAGIKVYEIYMEHLDAEDFFIQIMGGENYA
ncbi:MAG: ATP-binding cassette domain-containing protein [Lachnospiraceae bacterium]|nr:ATP-binding cassette domain-containing protein [Lachnospiraceae bacterium]